MRQYITMMCQRPLKLGAGASSRGFAAWWAQHDVFPSQNAPGGEACCSALHWAGSALSRGLLRKLLAEAPAHETLPGRCPVCPGTIHLRAPVERVTVDLGRELLAVTLREIVRRGVSTYQCVRPAYLLRTYCSHTASVHKGYLKTTRTGSKMRGFEGLTQFNGIQGFKCDRQSY